MLTIAALALLAWPAHNAKAAAPAAVGATFFGPAHAGQPPQSPDVRVLLSAGVVGGKCADATSHTAVGTACSMTLDAEFPVDNNCSGTGPGLLRYFPSSGEPPAYNIGGTVVITAGRSGSFTGSLLNAGTGGIANATVHFLLTGDACTGSGANGSQAGYFAFAAA
jgi:hypothetical protein